MKRILLLSAICLSFLMAKPASADLIISEYIEGSSNNKAIELFNTGTGSINLANVTLDIFFNGSGTASNVISLGEISGTLVSGGVFTIAHSSWALGGTVNYSDGLLQFNGDDAIRLSLSSVAVDIIGQIGFDPGSEWGSGLQSTQDNTLTRNIGILTGDINGADVFVPSAEWRGAAQNTHSLGTHDGNFQQVPEPSSLLVLGLLGGVLAIRRRR